MLKADGKDITKRSSARRNRYLLVFNCQLAPAAAGRLGTLARLDTKNPVMYIDFPEGRLRLSGTLVFPKNKYIVLRLGKEALCEDVLESMIVFSKSHWVGTEAENPDENALPMPESLKTTCRHTNVDFGGRGDNKGTTGINEVEYEETQDEDIGDGSMGLLSQQNASQPPSQRRGSRRAGATGKRARYAEDSDASFDNDDDQDDDGEDEEPAPRKLPRVANYAATAVRKLPSVGKNKPSAHKTNKKKPPSHVVINLADDSSDDEDQPLVARRVGVITDEVKRTSTGKKATPQAKKSPKSQASEEEEEVIDLASASSDEEVEDDEDAGDAVQASQRPGRAAARAASQKLRDTEDEDDASEADGGNSDGEEGDSDGAAVSESEEDYAEDDASGEESDGYAPSE
jgi:hypothetical protein